MKKTSQVDGRTLPRLFVQEKGGLTRPVYDETIVQEKSEGIQFIGRDSENSELAHPMRE